MDLQSLKGKTVDDSLLSQLVEHVDGLVAQRDAARKESIEGRKGKDAKIKEQSERISALSERLGIEPDADLESLPDARGQAEAAKQVEAKLKRLEREKAEFEQKFSELSSRYASERQSLAIEKALSSQPFVDMEDARAIFAQRVKAEGDELLFETPEGKLVPLADGAAWLAKTKTHLVRVDGGGGSGFKPAAGGGAGSATKGSFGGSADERRAAIAARFPELAQQG